MDTADNSPMEAEEQLTFQVFQEEFQLGKEDFCRDVFRENRDTIQIKKEKTAIKKLSRIFDATFRICSKKGFRGMSMRELSQESGLSMGGLYAYFRSKEELLNTLQRVGNSFIHRNLEKTARKGSNARTRLRIIIKTHLYLSEIVQPWFYFSYMEAKSMSRKERDFYKQAELYTENLILEILKSGVEEGLFKEQDHQLAASVIKSMLQDWYLKRWKYTKREISVDRYAAFLIQFIESFYCPVREVSPK
jgi:TetR/AcrR family transcriptional regulator, cholesterol catabolism regulator